MITCMPTRMCTQVEVMNSSMMMATGGEPRICAAAAWLRPNSNSTIRMNAMASGTLATAVSRCTQK